jgi:hypothetical protein
MPRTPAPPEAPEAESPRTVIRAPRAHGDGFEIYQSTPGADGKWKLSVPKLRHLDDQDVTPEMKEKIERSLEKAQRAVEKARGDQARASKDEAKARARSGSTLNAQSRREVESLMRDMRSQMESMREEMNRLRAELERTPRNEAR